MFSPLGKYGLPETTRNAPEHSVFKQESEIGCNRVGRKLDRLKKKINDYEKSKSEVRMFKQKSRKERIIARAQSLTHDDGTTEEDA